jgi:protein gp37
MSKSKIEWTEETWNPIVGCSILSPGCIHCYAMPMAARIEAINAALVAEGKPPQSPQYDGTTKKVNGSAVWTGKIALAGEHILLQPLKRKKPTTYFVNSMGDLFHEDCPDEWIDRVFAVMALCPQHTFQVLTKRAARMRDYCSATYHAAGRWNAAVDIDCKIHLPEMHPCYGMLAAGKPLPWPLPNVWLGVSTERQKEANERIPELLRTQAAVRFISYEPALGPLDLTDIVTLECRLGRAVFLQAVGQLASGRAGSQRGIRRHGCLAGWFGRPRQGRRSWRQGHHHVQRRQRPRRQAARRHRAPSHASPLPRSTEAMSGNAIFFSLLAIPAAGFVLAVIFSSMWWLILLLPLFAFMEGGLLLIIVALVVAASIIG